MPINHDHIKPTWITKELMNRSRWAFHHPDYDKYHDNNTDTNPHANRRVSCLDR